MKSLLAVCVLALLASCGNQVSAESGNPTAPAANAVKVEGGSCCEEGAGCCADKAAAKEAKGECCGACAPEVQAVPKAAGQ